MAVRGILGEQRGDEGKGRFADLFAAKHDIVARFNGGNNAGHTVVLPNGEVLKLHTVPCGIAHPGVINIIGNGTLVNAMGLVEEIADISSRDIEVSKDNLMISSAAHLILPHHVFSDEIREASASRQGSTQSGIAQSASFKALRTGARVEMINDDPDRLLALVYEGLMAQRQLRQESGLDEQREDAGLEKINEREMAQEYVASAKMLGAFVADTVVYLNGELRKDRPARVLAEGAQAFLLDIDHGMYPYTTSSSTTAGGISTGLGISPTFIDRITGVSKAVPSHVGGGPFVTEVTDPEVLARLYGDMDAVDAERGATTGRKRQLGYLDLAQIRRAQLVNGTHDMILSKLDWVPRYGDEIPVCVAYKINGKRVDIAPDSARQLERSTPEYEYLPAWDEDVQDARTFEDLPENAQNYIEFIEEKTKVPISMIGVGLMPDQLIVR